MQEFLIFTTSVATLACAVCIAHAQSPSSGPARIGGPGQSSDSNPPQVSGLQTTIRNMSTCLNRRGGDPSLGMTIIENRCNEKVGFTYCTIGPVDDGFNCGRYHEQNGHRDYGRGATDVGPGGVTIIAASRHNRVVWYGCPGGLALAGPILTSFDSPRGLCWSLDASGSASNRSRSEEMIRAEQDRGERDIGPGANPLEALMRDERQQELASAEDVRRDATLRQQQIHEEQARRDAAEHEARTQAAIESARRQEQSDAELRSEFGEAMTTLFGSIIGARSSGSPASSGGNSTCDTAYAQAAQNARQTKWSNSCAQNRRTLDYLSRLTNQVVSACGANSSQGRAFQDELKLANSNYESGVRHGICR